MRALGVDPGEKRIGLAVSDENMRLARPLSILKRTSHKIDAARILAISAKQEAGLIVIGQSVDEEGQPTWMGRMSGRLAEAISTQSGIRVILWDEAMSTSDAKANRILKGASRTKRREPIDAEAAAVMLQSYLDTHRDQA